MKWSFVFFKLPHGMHSITGNFGRCESKRSLCGNVLLRMQQLSKMIAAKMKQIIFLIKKPVIQKHNGLRKKRYSSVYSETLNLPRLNTEFSFERITNE